MVHLGWVFQCWLFQIRGGIRNLTLMCCSWCVAGCPDWWWYTQQHLCMLSVYQCNLDQNKNKLSVTKMHLKLSSANKVLIFCLSLSVLTHWGRVTHNNVSKLTSIGSDNGLSPGWGQAISWTNAGLLLIGTLATKFSEILIKILTFSFKKMWLKVLSAKSRPCCLGFNVL